MSTPLVSDDLIDSGATLYATECDYASIEQAYERGAKSLRDIYEAELQSMRDRLSRMEEAGSRMKILHMDHRDQEDASLFTDVMDAIDQWNAALSNK